MFLTVLLVFASWLVIGAVLAYVWLARVLRLNETAETAQLEREHRELIKQHQT